MIVPAGPESLPCGGKGSTRTSFGGGGYASHGAYMVEKNRKLKDQFAVHGDSGDAQAEGSDKGKPQIFKGLSFWMTGRTCLQDQELKRLIVEHGGIYEQYGFTRVSHIIADNLATGNQTWRELKSRIKRGHVVTSVWIVDCTREGRRIPEGDYMPKCLMPTSSLRSFVARPAGESPMMVSSDSSAARSKDHLADPGAAAGSERWHGMSDVKFESQAIGSEGLRSSSVDSKQASEAESQVGCVPEMQRSKGVEEQVLIKLESTAGSLTKEMEQKGFDTKRTLDQNLERQQKRRLFFPSAQVVPSIADSNCGNATASSSKQCSLSVMPHVSCQGSLPSELTIYSQDAQHISSAANVRPEVPAACLSKAFAEPCASAETLPLTREAPKSHKVERVGFQSSVEMSTDRPAGFSGHAELLSLVNGLSEHATRRALDVRSCVVSVSLSVTLQPLSEWCGSRDVDVVSDAAVNRAVGAKTKILAERAAAALKLEHSTGGWGSVRRLSVLLRVRRRHGDELASSAAEIPASTLAAAAPASPSAPPAIPATAIEQSPSHSCLASPRGVLRSRTRRWRRGCLTGSPAHRNARLSAGQHSRFAQALVSPQVVGDSPVVSLLVNDASQEAAEPSAAALGFAAEARSLCQASAGSHLGALRRLGTLAEACLSEVSRPDVEAAAKLLVEKGELEAGHKLLRLLRSTLPEASS